VLRDYKAGRVTLEGARRDYGVAIVEGAVQHEQTGALRSSRPERIGFDAGPARSAHEALWDAEAYAAMHELLGQLPVSWRAPVKKKLFAAVRQAGGLRPAAEVIREAFTSYLENAGVQTA
jgi:N-methylhydantoinase B